MMDAVVSRMRTASAAASGYAMDFGQSFQPSKRARLCSEDAEMTENDANPSSSPSLMERLLMEISSSSWALSSERTIEQNESYLNGQLEHAALLSSGETGADMAVDQSRLQFSSLMETVKEIAPTQKQHVENQVRHAMDIVSWLLVLRQQETRRQAELMDRVRMVDKDVERKQKQIQQLHLDVDGLKQQMAQQENMFHAREMALVAERKALQQDKKQLEVMCAKLQGQETAFKAQLRRKDVEYERLKKSLQDAAQRSSKEQRGMSMGKALNGLSERKQSPAQRGSQTHETLLSKRLIDNLERKRDELLFENEALALNFEALQKQVESVSGQYRKAVQLFLAQRGGEGNTDETMELARVPIDDFAPTPLQLGVKANVSAFISSTVDKLGDKVRLFERAMQAELEYSTAHPSEDHVDALKIKLEEAHAIISEQDRLLQASLVVVPSPGRSISPSPIDQAVNKENIHVNTGKQQPRTGGAGLPPRGGRRRRVEQVVLEQWADEMDIEWHDVRRKHKHLEDERTLLQTQGELLDKDRLAFEMRSFEHFFGRIAVSDKEEEEIDLRDVDCPTTPRTAAYLKSIGIMSSVLES